jgi:hypothetical protein
MTDANQDDLVDRLRQSMTACRALDRSFLLAEAAGRIERLQCRVAELEAWQTQARADMNRMETAIVKLAEPRSARRRAANDSQSRHSSGRPS